MTNRTEVSLAPKVELRALVAYLNCGCDIHVTTIRTPMQGAKWLQRGGTQVTGHPVNCEKCGELTDGTVALLPCDRQAGGQMTFWEVSA